MYCKNQTKTVWWGWWHCYNIRFELESMSHILCIEVVNSWSDGDSGMWRFVHCSLGSSHTNVHIMCIAITRWGNSRVHFFMSQNKMKGSGFLICTVWSTHNRNEASFISGLSVFSIFTEHMQINLLLSDCEQSC